jgi:hypothetical protein
MFFSWIKLLGKLKKFSQSNKNLDKRLKEAKNNFDSELKKQLDGILKF